MRRITIILGLAGIVIALIAVGLWKLPQWNGHSPLNGEGSSQEKKKVISKEQAIEIARKAWSYPLPADEIVEATLDERENNYVVVFRRPPPPEPVPRSDYRAKITIDALTGEVKHKLGG